MLILDVAFYYTRLKQRVSAALAPLAGGESWVGRKLREWGRAGFEDEMEKRMRGFAKKSLGMDVDKGVFNG